ncbi:inorganic diphosphatase [Pedobacter yulinensis]|uniref:inorganic diphosphatase n=1 Tax=Pedobacter yulinensis TaxID=2126353 RepID=UPI0013A65D36|nr:inorganic diphosphatase [Pedobacter yulinensis]
MDNNITVIIETPKGSGQKFDYDPELDRMKLNKVLPAGLIFPFDFGYIPGTIGGDGDPVDALVISELATFPGCALDCRVIGALKARQRERDGATMRNDRIIAIPVVSVQYAAVNTFNDLPPGILEQLTRFFINYNEQAGKKFSPLKNVPAREAISLINTATVKQPKDTLIQLFIPTRDASGKPFPESHFSRLRTELKDRFGGLTIYARTPAKGLWKDQGNTVEDELVIYEVMTAGAEPAYWSRLKTKLEKRFAQQEILILAGKVQQL